jgi:hypothetical protein
LHIFISDGCFHASDLFTVASAFDTKALEKIFRHKVLKMLLAEGKITADLIALMGKWRHSGFNVYSGPRILPWQKKYMETLARGTCPPFLWRIIRASFSQERMTYIPEESKITYQSKGGKQEKVFDPLEWLAAMCSHVPNKGEQMVRYYGYYSNVSRGRRKKANTDELIPTVLEPELTSKAFRRNWARLIQKIAACLGPDPGKLTL